MGKVGQTADAIRQAEPDGVQRQNDAVNQSIDQKRHLNRLLTIYDSKTGGVLSRMKDYA